MRAGERVLGLDAHKDLTEAELDATERIVAMAGVHPFIELLKQGADVIIGGRSSDSCVFAAPAIHHGFPEAQAYYLGKVLECASFCAEPYGGKETVLGEVTAEDVRVTAMHPDQRCTVASVAGHAMYERSNPVFRARRRRHARHVRVPLRAGRPRRPRASPARASSRRRNSASSSKARARSASATSAWSASATRTPSRNVDR